MIQQDNGRRRRADDFTLNPEEAQNLYPGEDRRRMRTGERRVTSGRSFLRRFRHPIIGLSMAGAAAPLINAGSQSETQPQTSTSPPTEADLARQAPEAAVDTEEKVAARIAEEHHGTERAAIVEEAVAKFDIDESLAHDIYDISQQEGIEPKLAYGLVKTESAFKNRAVSHVGARGLTQVMPRTAAWMVPGTKAEDLYDQKTNLKLGFRYLNQMIDKYKGNVRNALLAYNRGPGTVDKVLRRGGDPNNGYADKVLRGWRSS
ncbi:MAG: lytic transglycosylase domain-containing protein [Gemmatimonadota bacterium]